MINPWPAEMINQETFIAALQAIAVPQGMIDKVAPVEEAELPAPINPRLRETFIKALATPEQRQTLAKAAGCGYQKLTDWVIRSDLMRVENISAGTAKLLAKAGVKGVRDLAACAEHVQRLKKLERDLNGRLTESQLRNFAAAARQLDMLTVTDVSVILVVKGAGLQKPDETLDVFVNGFWPAIKAVDPKAALSKRRDIFPSDYRSSVYDKEPNNQVTEVSSGERRIWIKEPNWEAAIVPDSPLKALVKEWRMATYAFGSSIHNLFKVDSQHPPREFHQFYISFFLMYWLVFWHISMALFGTRLMRWATSLFSAQDGLDVFKRWLMAGTIAIIFLAVLPAIETMRRMREYPKDKRIGSLPGMWSWVMLVLTAVFVWNPGSYILSLLFLATLQLALLRARALAWPCREFNNSDSAIEDYYQVDDGTGKAKIHKLTTNQRPRLDILVYRYIIVLSLPISFLALTVARLLKWTRVLGGLGDAIESAASTLLSGVMGDVATYATDPAQAHRVRSVVEADYKFFHDRPEVSHIHVFAHSQGTPITFEMLFHHLPGAYREKLKTYATIGSVLSYYNQINPILDPVYIQRFPVLPYPQFPKGFKWMNFWNLIDPITEFYGLDEYNLVKEAYKLKPKQASKTVKVEELRKAVKRGEASPTNIKTPATTQHHGEYWSNQDQVQIPLALRVLGVLRPKQWNPDKLILPPFGLSHSSYVLWLTALWGTLFFAIYFAVVAISTWLANLSLPAFRQALAEAVPQLFAGFVETQQGTLRALLMTLAPIVQILALRYSLELIPVLVALAVLAALAFLSVIGGYVISVAQHLNKLRAA
ncbi:MAG: DUF4332 domain-containing protein [Chloroflexi bacterium]|nr:DUF4332 domain-containing protein [Chloroflexota bacterium]